ncbi:GSCFA domain-containing protein [Neotamlana laminarinivorans]|uniref:GSCFA domain-containing protein n=1 Tax=Neotamlana laminarinivorans TaxID=2883124 RepID=A0A9X1I0Y4_9FLAO|nr:GSCFA domain-containing protein [Tamlana laminarinivorans]MCB4799426.1 GSCFA domain-containing protein [Tamlana laminarinivorans]
MNLQTKIPLSKQSGNLINYHSNILLLGSCFSENIGDKLEYFKFKNFQNPFGILFHPIAIEVLITDALNNKIYTDNDVFFHNEQWHCFNAHSKLSNTSKEELLNKLNLQLQNTKIQLQTASHIVITLGTAWVYRLIENNSIVANCHKIPQKNFKKELLSVQNVSESLQNIINQIRTINKDSSIIFAVSPVRHLKDGFIENTRSKSHLISAIHHVINVQSANKIGSTNYFPSFEIMMDELRDYRFYNIDMLHPNQLAINYIWENFKQVWINEKVYSVINEVDKVQKSLQHKPFNENSESHKKFLEKIKVKIEAIQSQYPHLLFSI